MDLTRVAWRKSSRSGGNGANCVEVAAVWRKSSRSGGNGADCVELAELKCAIAARDSKDPEGPQLWLARPAFAQLLDEIKTGKHDLR